MQRRWFTVWVVLALSLLGSAQDQNASSLNTQSIQRVGLDEAKAHLVKKVPPKYPLEARRKLVHGTVVLNCIIDRGGNVTEVKPVSGPDLLVQPAIDAVRQFKYNPFLFDGQPATVEAPVNVVFSLWVGNDKHPLKD